MLPATGFLRQAAVTLALVPAAIAFKSVPASADEGFPFGFEMTLETAPQPGSKRLPTLEIGDNGEATLDLWCKSGKGQFSVAGNTVIFVPGPLQDRSCPPARAQDRRSWDTSSQSAGFAKDAHTSRRPMRAPRNRWMDRCASSPRVAAPVCPAKP